jgi:signal transduction histidine kinase
VDERSRRLATQALMAEQRERRRISEAIHADPLQVMLAARHDAAELPGAEGVTEKLDLAIERLRAVIWDLHPATRASEELAEVIGGVVARETARVGITGEVRVASDLPQEWADLIVPLVSELTANVAQHAGADLLSVDVTRVSQGLVVRVSDNGRGITPEQLEQALSERHIGLLSVVDRVESLGGRLEIFSAPGEGTHVVAWLSHPPASGVDPA